ncbi:MAG: hypothetical protein QOG87_2101 [Actinomycetota bacterium]
MEGRTDPVVSVDVAEPEWVDLQRQHHDVRRRLHAPLFTCVDCHHPLHPKRNERGTQFFAHNPDAPDTCPLKALEHSESPEHQRLKVAIYRAAKRTGGWDADIEVPAPDPDPITGKPVRVDVVAKRQAPGPAGSPALQGWEVQLSPIVEGHVLSRQEHRDRFLDRCTWVTRSRPAWAESLPWYQIAPKTDDHVDLVVGGVVRWVEYGAGRGGDYFDEDPFPQDDMVRYVLRGARWTQDIGWELRDTTTARRPGQRQPRRESVQGIVADYCNRTIALPEYTREWSDRDWFNYSKVAHDRRQHNERLGELELEAIFRFPAPGLLEGADLEALTLRAFDHLTDTRPCILCGDVVVVSASVEFPVHHRCAWYTVKGEAIPPLGTGIGQSR